MSDTVLDLAGRIADRERMQAGGFDPNAAAAEGAGIFGLADCSEEARLVYLPVPWDATTSYGGGSASGPAAILKASHQLDLFDAELGRVYEAGLSMRDIPAEILAWNGEARAHYAAGDRAALNRLSARVNEWVRTQTLAEFAAGRFVGVVGGDHSVPLGAFHAAAEQWGAFGILHVDAHLDLRAGYEGYVHSHASIMHNAVTEIDALAALVQVGVRDYCEAEWTFAASRAGQIRVFGEADLRRRVLAGEPWAGLAHEIVAPLPERVWVSFDIDGLDPRYCPHTGTPVPGGLDWAEVLFLFRTLVESGRRIIGFDLCEVVPSPSLGTCLAGEGAPKPGPADEWDANVGMRLLYKLSGWLLRSQGLLPVAADPAKAGG